MQDRVVVQLDKEPLRGVWYLPTGQQVRAEIPEGVYLVPKATATIRLHDLGQCSTAEAATLEEDRPGYVQKYVHRAVLADHCRRTGQVIPFVCRGF